MFVIDVKRYPLNDIKADDNGTWINNGKRMRFLKRICNKDGKVKLKKCDKFDCDLIVLKAYYYSKANPDFKRKIIRVESTNDEERIDKCLLAYFLSENNECEININAHGNSKKNLNPILRSSETTLKKVNKFNSIK
jgi:hypothetical protein